MRLLKIGRDSSCDIVLQSAKVSSLHAELTLLNNGDITVEDKGSHNGTFIMNQPIKPGKPVKVRRGDAIRFADVELQWSQVPMPEDNSAYRAIYGIGSHFNNDIQISGATVSRYHATIKQGKDGKIYLFDHSKNGTTVDGVNCHTPQEIFGSGVWWCACRFKSVVMAKYCMEICDRYCRCNYLDSWCRLWNLEVVAFWWKDLGYRRNQ